ncbi:MAG: metallophosphoesterase family protein [Desulfobacteraceae bacterium]
MRLAVISDIHSNLEAFRAVLEDIKKVRAEKVISLGDNIGYGADPEEVMNLIRKHQIESVMGNHELALMDPSYLRSFHPHAGKALSVNSKLLSAGSLEDIKRMPVRLVRRDCRFVHGFPPDSVTTYIIHQPRGIITSAMENMTESIAFTGHTHYLGLYELKQGSLKIHGLDKWGVALDENRRYIVNAGSVGQPRKGEILATYVIWDSVRSIIVPRFLEYDNQTAAGKIRKAGIPGRIADRLVYPEGGR